jgi:prepilin-type N-terminal cleavage/methylation domain-containing protein
MISTRQGFTLIELIVAMVLVGLAAALVGTSFMSFTRIGEGKNYARNAQLAQQRMELILARKRTTSDFSNLDPCDDEDAGLEIEDFCDDVSIVSLKAYDKNDVLLNEDDTTTCNVEEVRYCVVHIEVGGDSQKQDFYMRLYHYE